MACELLVAAYGIQFPDQGLNLEPPALGAWSLSHWTTREVPIFILIAVIHVTILKCTIQWNLIHSWCCAAVLVSTFHLLFSHLVLSNSFATPWTVAHQAPLSMEFPRQESWSGLPYSSLRGLPQPRDQT